MIMYLFTTKTFGGMDIGWELALNTQSQHPRQHIQVFIKTKQNYVLRNKKKGRSNH